MTSDHEKIHTPQSKPSGICNIAETSDFTTTETVPDLTTVIDTISESSTSEYFHGALTGDDDNDLSTKQKSDRELHDLDAVERNDRYDDDDCGESSCCTDSDSDVDSEATFEKPGFDTSKMHGDRIMFPEAGLTVSDVLMMTESFSMAKNLSKRDQDHLIDFIKILAGPKFDKWESSHYLRSQAFGVPANKLTLHFYCEACSKILKTQSLENSTGVQRVTCTQCEEVYNLSSQSPNSFISADIRYQLQMLLGHPNIQKSLFQHIADTANKDSKTDICDVQDSILYKKLKSHHPGILTLNFNTDGAPIFKSSTQSFWPQQLHINELPLELRFKHMILGGVFLTNKEPKPDLMNLYNTELCNQIINLMEDGVNILHHSTGEIVNLKFTLFCCCVDSVARPVCQNRIQFNGYFGCSWCYDSGKYAGHALRYPITEAEPRLRTHEEHMQNLAEVQKLKESSKGKKHQSTIMGVKGSTPFIEKLRLMFDIVWGFPLDYMHCVLLGVVRQIWFLLITFASFCYVNHSDRTKINTRLSKIRPPHEIYRLPRPLKDISKWKASEFESWLLYWSVICFDGIVNASFLESYTLLVRSIHTLLKRRITKEDLERSEYDLLKFVGDCQIMFEETALTFNLHSLLHLTESVKRSGPLWATSAFPFENGIFYHKKNVKGPKGVGHQIAKKWLKKTGFLSRIDESTTSTVCKNYCRKLFEHERLRNCLELSKDLVLVGRGRVLKSVERKMKEYLNDENITIQIFNKCLYRGTVIHSKEYSRAQKTDDTHILLHSQEVIHIHHLVAVGEKCYVYGRHVKTSPFSVGKVQLDHIHEVCNDYEENIVVKNIENFKEKVIHVDLETKAYVCFFPCFISIN